MRASFYGLLLVQLLSLTGATESGIIGGKVSKPHSRPYMASLQFGGKHSCGGILVSKDFVLTAAHCKDPVRGMTVVLGAHDLSKKETSQQSIPVAALYPHPNFKKDHFEYDIMLLKLKTNAKLNKKVKTIGLPKKNGKIPANLNCLVAGWGYTGNTGPASKVLKETMERIQFSHECKMKWQQHFNTTHMLCTKIDKKNGGFCQGDSGGPLICNSKPQGIIAYTVTKQCNNSKYPHVFTNIHPFLPWIKKIMQG